jgi:hypothetical protein
MADLILERRNPGIEFSSSSASFMGQPMRLAGLKTLPLAQPRHIVAGAHVIAGEQALSGQLARPIHEAPPASTVWGTATALRDRGAPQRVL